mmetsp:Transcript_4922/g.10644  ORF Transcript_4922/g.10644 Transcript_4922/m.10644 type:complete len:287 (+) Transcript_4922:179-1039(+)
MRICRTNYILTRLATEFKQADKHDRGVLSAKTIVSTLNHIGMLTARNSEETKEFIVCLCYLPLVDPAAKFADKDDHFAGSRSGSTPNASNGRPSSRGGRPVSRNTSRAGGRPPVSQGPKKWGAQYSAECLHNGTPFIQAPPKHQAELQKTMVDYNAFLAMARRFAMLQGAKVSQTNLRRGNVDSFDTDDTPSNSVASHGRGGRERTTAFYGEHEARSSHGHGASRARTSHGAHAPYGAYGTSVTRPSTTGGRQGRGQRQAHNPSSQAIRPPRTTMHASGRRDTLGW